ncbi:pentapeptide repeat-containing protein [Flavobacterium litorale]|uniref:Pentapeptide repeat-containing protein n=1 Tax=Flavobacterium litorale TaxID=2856519 RepID=A0ABX8V7M2_9FLAO|nr:pentapeptide repeat-containing protein [Flavobacterium litorale]QYJ68842.1 hypothetical protein K1I41_02880 [Flavobacterium litorale]
MSWTEKKFYETLLYDGKIKDQTINFGEVDIEIIGFTNDTIELVNCHITAKNISFKDIKNQNLSIRFTSCSLNTKLRFENCKFQNLEFMNITNLIALYMIDYASNEKSLLELNRFYFLYDNETKETHLETYFYFNGCNFLSEFYLKKVKHYGSNFILENNVFGSNSKYYESFSINSSKLNNVAIAKNQFKSIFLFRNCSFTFKIKDKLKYRNTIFIENVFNKIAFSGCNFEDKTSFLDCTFNDVANFERIENLNNSSLLFTGCEFSKYTTFSNALVSSLSFKRTTFHNIASFQEAEFKTLILDKVSFEKFAYFDGIKITKRTCNRATLRTIKQQLQSAENKIDYNRFRAYELAAYNKELKWNKNFRDKFILSATWLATGFDYSWMRALVFTLLSGFLFYSLFFIWESYMYPFDLSYWKKFLSGYFRFLLITDFYNPLAKEREFLTHPLSWFLFILGKVVIAFGIYEMIQAFRKFKA